LYDRIQWMELVARISNIGRWEAFPPSGRYIGFAVFLQAGLNS
jgi:hypothetical protein